MKLALLPCLFVAATAASAQPTFPCIQPGVQAARDNSGVTIQTHCPPSEGFPEESNQAYCWTNAHRDLHRLLLSPRLLFGLIKRQHALQTRVEFIQPDAKV